ncbi:hypothetical protein [Actinocrispum wychmicini]|uniref:Uncharacterized protein n=1 Tax=Actinocrispum wychmicini TaxID=1213861 RepID=A0A4V2S7D7_9PSEU|nr:hypothetical protein [Actinocrispum wychmicini]TCO59400.1 hypothetical protein EV192_104241 [Actinocrispum wychmicini]
MKLPTSARTALSAELGPDYIVLDLHSAPTTADASKTTLPGVDGYHHRYEGLRLAFVDWGSYFLIPRVWSNTHGKLIVLRQDGLRVEFLQ